MKQANVSLVRIAIILSLAVFFGIGFIFFFYPIRDVSTTHLIISLIAISVLFFITFSRKTFEPYYQLKRRNQRFSFTFLVLYTLCLLLSLKGEQYYLQDNSTFTKIYVYVSTYIVLFALILVIVRFLFRLRNDKKEVSKVHILWYAVPSMAVFSLYLAGLFPGIMTVDSLFQWIQIHILEFNDWHPVVHTWFLLLLTKIWDSPAVVGIAQILIMSLVFAYGAYRFRKQGANKWIVYLAIVGFACMPINGVYSVTLWKDILFSTAIMFLTILLFNIVSTEGKWLHKNTNVLLFFIASVGVVFFRHNGFPAFLVTMIIFFIIFRFKLVKMYAVAIVVIALHFIVTGPIFSYFHVKPSDPNEAYAIPIQQIGRVISYDGNITKEQLEYYGQVLPLEEWKNNYNPYIADPLKGSQNYNRKFLYANKAEFFEHWLELCKQNPKLVTESYLDITSLVWQIKVPADGYTSTYGKEPPSPEVLKEHRIKVAYGSEKVQTVLSKVLTKVENSPLNILNRPAVYLFIMILCLFVTAIKSNWKLILVALPCLLNAGTVAVALPAQDVRYLYANILVTYILFLMASVQVKREQQS